MCSADNFSKMWANYTTRNAIYLMQVVDFTGLIQNCRQVPSNLLASLDQIKSVKSDLLQFDICRLVATWYLQTCCNLIFADLLQFDICRLVTTRYSQTCCNLIFADLLQLDICRLVTTRYSQTCCNSIFADLLQLDICRLVASWYLHVANPTI